MAAEQTQTGEHKRHYFVDEAGDPILFDAKGRVLPGTAVRSGPNGTDQQYHTPALAVEDSKSD